MRQLKNVYECENQLYECKGRGRSPTHQLSRIGVDGYLDSHGEDAGTLVRFEEVGTRLNIPIDDYAQPHVSSLVFIEGGGTFFCLLLILIIMIFLLFQLLIWRIFDIDMFPVDDSISNHDLSNTSIHRLDKMGKLP